MPQDAPERTGPHQEASEARGIPAGLLVALIVAVPTLLGVGTRYCVQGDFNAIHGLFSLFFSLNLLICYWEACLYFRRDSIAARSEHWRRWQRETGRAPAVAFLTARVPLGRALSPAVWADVWAAYSTIDPSYPDRRTFGFSADVGNGFVTPLPTLFLYAAYSAELVPAVVAGIVGAMLFWQWVYVSSLYWVSFFVAERQHHVTRRDLYTYVVAPNAVWVFVPAFGLYVSLRLILDGSYAVLGF